MVIIQDTREKDGKKEHILSVFKELNIPVLRKKLNYGDYMLFGKEYISVDIKQDVMEIVNNYTIQHDRFKRECENAQKHGVKLIFLIEEPLNSIYSLKYWKCKKYRWKVVNGKRTREPYTKMSGESLMKGLLTMQRKYGCEFRFCKKEESAYKILKILLEEE